MFAVRESAVVAAIIGEAFVACAPVYVWTCQIDFDVIDKPPAPSLKRVVALNYRVTGRFKVTSGMTIGRLVAATDMPATAAKPQMPQGDPMRRQSSQPSALG